MSTEQLQIILKAKNACEKAQNACEKGVEELCKMYFANDDWAIENQFPTAEMIREHEQVANKYGLYTDNRQTHTNQRFLAFYGDSAPTLVYTGYCVGSVNLLGNTHAKINVSENAIVYINVYESATFETVEKHNAKIKVFNKKNLNK